jgi:hypothetical protein
MWLALALLNFFCCLNRRQPMFIAYKKHGWRKGLIHYQFLATTGMSSAEMVGGVALQFLCVMD